jgi:hypothetical protein
LKRSNELAIFETHAKYWLDKLSLNEWATFFLLDALIDSDAEVVPNFDDMGATFRLKDGDRTLSISYSGRHEALEVLVREIFHYAEQFYSEEFLTPIRHRLIHKLEKVLPLPTDKEVGYTPRKK